MFIQPLRRIVAISLGLACVFGQSVPTVSASTNLLTNPGAELDGAGWSTIQNGGDGMSYDFDAFVRSGTKSFQTSFGLDSISQTVDLYANGYSAEDMNQAPSISMGVWVGTRNDQAGQYYVKFSLLAADGATVVTSTSFGSEFSLISIDAGTDWTQVSHTFSQYGNGIRYAKIEFGGQDQSFWAGNYGTHFDDASITVSPVNHGGTSMPWWGYVPPKGPFSITLQEGGSITNSPQVMLKISASSDVDRMAFSRYEDFRATGIIPFAESLPWSICGEPSCAPGTYDLYAKFYQSYGLASPVQHISITYTPTVQKTEPIVSMSLSAPNQQEKKNLEQFVRDLRPGDRGEDVKRLQKFLNEQGYTVASKGNGSRGNETDVYGPALRRALARFQEAYADKILAPLDIKKGSGIFGTRTRSLVNEITAAPKIAQN